MLKGSRDSKRQNCKINEANYIKQFYFILKIIENNPNK